MLTPSEESYGLCFNACVLSRALCRGRKRLFPDGETLLRELTEAQIDALCRQYLERFAPQTEAAAAVNPSFDAARFEELKRQ